MPWYKSLTDHVVDNRIFQRGRYYNLPAGLETADLVLVPNYGDTYVQAVPLTALSSPDDEYLIEMGPSGRARTRIRSEDNRLVLEKKESGAWVGMAQAGEIFAQVNAVGFNPLGGAGDMALVQHGISLALEASGTANEVAAVNIAIPALSDKTQVSTVRIGWSTSSTTTSNSVRFAVQYRWLGVGTATDGAADGELVCDCTPSAVSDGYQVAAFELPAPGVDARVCQLRLVRYGAVDTDNAAAHVLGLIQAFTPIETVVLPG